MATFINKLDNKNQPIINVIVFHDGENCFIPKKEISRNENGRMDFIGSRTKFKNNNIDYTAELIKQNVVKECFDILKNNDHKRNIPFSNFPNININNIDFRKVNTQYYFVLQKFNNNRCNYYPSFKTTDSISNSLFSINAHTKGVDLKINDLIDASLKLINKETPTLFIIISGDGDFRNSIQNAYQAGCECCVLFNSDTKLTDNFDAFIKDCGFSRNSWWNILYRCIVYDTNNNSIFRIDDQYNNSNIKKVEPVKIEPVKIEIKKVEPAKVEIKKVEPAKVEIKKVEIKKVEIKKVEIKKVEPAKIEIKKVEPAKVEIKKVELAKVEIKKS